MSLIQNSRSLTKSCLPFFSKPRNTGNTSDKRNTPNYVIHVIHLIQVFTSSTSNASNTSDASYASNESNASKPSNTCKSSTSVSRLSSYSCNKFFLETWGLPIAVVFAVMTYAVLAISFYEMD